MTSTERAHDTSMLRGNDTMPTRHVCRQRRFEAAPCSHIRVLRLPEVHAQPVAHAVAYTRRNQRAMPQGCTANCHCDHCGTASNRVLDHSSTAERCSAMTRRVHAQLAAVVQRTTYTAQHATGDYSVYPRAMRGWARLRAAAYTCT